ncbi:putative disease resistance protein RGA3 [Mangifera indica]|uniref:putative disease resistance protein RGA3 n=1 Tax=Mangifera indica TaxID=29780 RepID=UPI001CF97F4D|nr:putative disease resistance protein RGA3 [Mangifera indica]XP_044509753.1 putative disease resistance protein RGA3 [Mangifera indica]XP_044509754.1 putative disease resistance protein RGA3 [Mangifera indica]XP_044509755.1 putative disease resistance protein RGA3 [Mangifera indica]XP_044509756.1 putative disease resistance protein RGA3 [Mangifera indica]XP_044509757.1 putative disease resistance protein RGA3 [Mangifera indica]XP_044509759.1 putative disease resistance protein RGA3 [Mangifer
MAETIVPVIAEKLFDKLITLASDEVSLTFGVKNDVEQLKDTLDTIKVVLFDAEEKQNHDPKLRVWLKKLKEVCYDAEDVLDEIEVENLHNQVVNRQSITKKVRHFCSSSNPIVFRFTLGHKIKEVNKRLAKIAADKNDFNLTEKIDSNHVIVWDRETHAFVRDSDVIGRDKDKEMIIERLLQPSYGHENVSVISIVGIGGLGKTTLAKWVNDDKIVSDHFNLRMWVCVSDEFSLKRLLIDIINSATEQKCIHMSLNQLQGKLRDVISHKRYLLILDDVWNEVHGLWLELKCLLNECVSGSKILVTTRSERVASTMDTVSTHKLEGLAFDQCLSIFVKCAFKEGQEKQHPKLIEMGKEIVKKCGGVPLAVRALGGLLHSSTSEQEWINVRDNEVWKSDQKENSILPALRISYNKLSPPLKQCFVYCFVFPKDIEFHSIKLIHFWMAHGLLHAHNQNEDLENIGMQYINELMWRSFFQDIKELGNDVYAFKIHDLMHDVATSLFQNECLTVKGSNQIACKTSYRHLFFHGVDGQVVTLNSIHSLSNVRSVMFSSMIEEHITISQSFLKLLISRLQFLRMLDLYDLNIEVVPKGIGNLEHLRYLELAFNPIKKLPSFIYKLQNLQYLSVRNCVQLEGLPREVKYLISLRWFILTTMQKHLPSNGIGCLNSLRHLGIHRCRNLEYLCEDIGLLRALRRLIISKCRSLISLPHGVRNLSSLEDLRILHCERLNLDLSTGSDNHEELNSTGPPLRFLAIFDLPKLVKLPQWLLQCSTNTLGEVIISSCPELSSLPEDMNSLISLRKLKIDCCPKLTGRCKPETGEDWSKIAHIPKIELDGEIIKSTEN